MINTCSILWGCAIVHLRAQGFEDVQFCVLNMSKLWKYLIWLGHNYTKIYSDQPSRTRKTKEIYIGDQNLVFFLAKWFPWSLTHSMPYNDISWYINGISRYTYTYIYIYMCIYIYIYRDTLVCIYIYIHI